MNHNNLHLYFKDLQCLKNEQQEEFEQIVEKYPYFTAARTILLKIYQLKGNTNAFEKALAKTAVASNNRDRLQEWVNLNTDHKPQTEPQLNQNPSPNPQIQTPKNNQFEPIVSKIEVPLPFKGKDIQDLEPYAIDKETIYQSKQNLLAKNDFFADPTPIEPFENTEKHYSLLEWLKIISTKNHNNEDTKTQKNNQIPDRELDELDKLIMQSAAKPSDYFAEAMNKQTDFEAIKSFTINQFKNPNQHQNQTDSQPVTETMAQIYASKGRFAEAIDVYQKLSLKMPEKSRYFATKIENLQNNPIK